MRTLTIILYLTSWANPAAFCQSEAKVYGIIHNNGDAYETQAIK